MNLYTEPHTWTDCLGKRSKLRNINMIFGTWNIISLSRAGSLTTVLKELSEWKLHLAGAQEVRRDRGSTEPAGEYTFFYGKGNKNH
jgi:hypothetical protein